MATIDYGAWLIKDGVLVNENQFFMNMKEAVGWSDDAESADRHGCRSVSGNYFAYAGDQDFTVAVYKTQILFLTNGIYDEHFYSGRLETEPYYRGVYDRMSLRLEYFFRKDGEVQSVRAHLKRIYGSVWRCSFYYNGSFYKLIFGYGIDPNIDTWNRVKVDYLGRKFARRCERELTNTNVQHKLRKV